MDSDTDRRARLVAVKARALATTLGLDPDAEPVGFGGGAAVVDTAAARAAVLIDEHPSRGLGPALARARQAGATTLDVLADTDAGLLARRAAAFAAPAVSVWWVQGRDLHPVEPEPLAPSPEATLEDLSLAPVLAEAGCDVVVEHGVVTGEVLGLEVARVVDGGIQVGVGRHDREAFELLHGELPTVEALAKVVGSVREHRRPDAPDHPLQRLAQARWLRELVLAAPGIVGVEALERHEGPVRRTNVKDPTPAVAVGDGPGRGERTVVVCSVGIDLDLVPFAADARLAATGDRDSRLVLVVPERDAHPVTRALAASLARPAELVTVPGGWRNGVG